MIFYVPTIRRLSAKVSNGARLAVVRYRRYGVKDGERPPWFDTIMMTESITDYERFAADGTPREINGAAINRTALG